jgi:hypothetical protein
MAARLAAATTIQCARAFLPSCAAIGSQPFIGIFQLAGLAHLMRTTLTLLAEFR